MRAHSLRLRSEPAEFVLEAPLPHMLRIPQGYSLVGGYSLPVICLVIVIQYLLDLSSDCVFCVFKRYANPRISIVVLVKSSGAAYYGDIGVAIARSILAFMSSTSWIL